MINSIFLQKKLIVQIFKLVQTSINHFNFDFIFLSKYNVIILYDHFKSGEGFEVE